MKRRITRILAFLLIAFNVLSPIRMDAASATDKDDLVRKLYKAMCSRKASVQIEYTSTDGSDIIHNFDRILDEIYAIDSKSTTSDADYLEGLLKWYSISYDGSIFTFSFKYYETLRQTKKVDSKVSSVLEYLDTDSMSNYDKVKAIHDYIVKRVSYDTKLQSSSAYEGLIKKSTVCSGYALLMYKMLNEAGVPSRVITGTAYNESGGGNHAWNIVKLGGSWYYVDVTWDDPVGGTKVYYDYFLKGSSDFKKDHFADKQYETKSFRDKYPISESEYVK